MICGVGARVELLLLFKDNRFCNPSIPIVFAEQANRIHPIVEVRFEIVAHWPLVYTRCDCTDCIACQKMDSRDCERVCAIRTHVR